MPKTVRLPIRIALAYVRREIQPPAHLADLVRQYRDLEYFIDSPIAQAKQDAVWERLLAGVSDTKTVAPDKQLRHQEQRAVRTLNHLERRADLTFTQKCCHAIDLWRQGVRV